MPVLYNLEPQEKEDGLDCHRLEFPGRFYGRDAELKRLYSMYKTIGSSKEKQSGESSPLALISGYAGTGKSALVCELRNQIFTDSRKEETGIKPCYFLSGKYDELQGGDLFSALVEAFSEFCNQLLDGDGDIDERGELRSAIRTAVGHESKVLTEIVPDLLRIIGQQKEDIDLNSNKEFDWNRLRYVFKKFVKAICTESRPLILFLDDLQWADEPSLDLVTDLMTDKSLPYFMFVGAFRSNEVDDSHPLTQRLAVIENGKKIDRINLADLFYDDIGAFIAGTLNLTTEETESLTKVVYDQTDGNIFYVMQSLEALRREQIIFKSEGNSTWKWDLAKLSLTAAKTSESVVEVVTAKIKTLPEHMQKALVIASFMPNSFDADTLEGVMATEGFKTSIEEVDSLLERAVMENLLFNSIGSKKYKFAHDRIKQASQALVPAGKAGDDARIRLAKYLLKRAAASDVGKDWMLFVAADNLNLTPSHGMTPLEMATLNLQVGERANQASAFVPARVYLKKGLESLNQIQNPWKAHYDLSLRLYRAAADVELCLGNCEVGDTCCQLIMEKALSVHDKLRASISLSDSLGRRERHADALEVHRKALCEIGEFPKHFAAVHVLRSLGKVKRLFKKHSDDAIMLLPDMTDERKLLTMSHLTRMSYRGFHSNNMVPLLLSVLKQLILTFKHGMCLDSTQAIAAYGSLLCGTFNDQEGGTRMGRLAQLLLEKMKTTQPTKVKNMECRVLTTTSIFIHSWAEPSLSVLENLHRASKCGMESGDFEHGCASWSSSNVHAYWAGFPLAAVEESGDKLYQQLNQYNVVAVRNLVDIFRFTVDQLMGKSQKPIDWKEIDEAPLHLEDGGESETWSWFYWSRIQLAYHFGEFEIGFGMIDPFRRISVIDTSYLIQSARVFYSGLTASALARRNKQKPKYAKMARKLLLEMQNFVGRRGLNNLHRYQLMKVNLDACLEPKKYGIREAFDNAIVTAVKGNFTADVAIGNELAGEHFSAINDNQAAKHYFSRAKKVYKEWGAMAKVTRLDNMYSNYIDDDLASGSQDSPSVAVSCDNGMPGTSFEVLSGKSLKDFSGGFNGSYFSSRSSITADTRQMSKRGLKAVGSDDPLLAGADDGRSRTANMTPGANQTSGR